MEKIFIEKKIRKSYLFANIFTFISVVVFLCAFFVCGTSVYANVLLTEIMYNPGSCSDSDFEWIELYNQGNESINMSNWTIDGKEIFEISGEKIVVGAGEYIVLADELVDSDGNFESFEDCILDNGETIDGKWDELDGNYLAYDFELSLSNSEDEIVLVGNFEGGEVFERVSYEKGLGANGNDHSLELNSEGDWKESLEEFGTPGLKNSRWDISSNYEKIIITEVMPNPEGSDDAIKPSGEWIEVYNQGDLAIDLLGLFFLDSAGNDLYISESNSVKFFGFDEEEEANLEKDLESKSTSIVEGDSYLVIFRNGDSSFSLNNNDLEEIGLYYQGEDDEKELIDSVSYSSSNEDMTFSLIEDEENNYNWEQTNPTKGYENKYVEGCDWKIDLDLGTSIFLTDDFDFEVKLERLSGSSQTLTVLGEIENYHGEIIKEYLPFTDEKVTNSKSKGYTPNLAEGVYQANFWIEKVDCEDYDLSNNEISSFFAINPEYQLVDSVISIEKIYLGNDESAEWGDQITAKVQIYKGDDSKYSLEIFAELNGETVSKRTKINAHDNYQYSELTVPLQLEPNCNSKLGTLDENGVLTANLDLVFEGLDLEVREGFEVKGIDEEVCKDYFNYIEENGAQFCFSEEELLFLENGSYEGDFENGSLESYLELLSSSYGGGSFGDENYDLESYFESLNNLEGFEYSSSKDNSGVVVYSSGSQKSYTLIPGLFLISCLILGFVIWKGDFNVI